MASKQDAPTRRRQKARAAKKLDKWRVTKAEKGASKPAAAKAAPAKPVAKAAPAKKAAAKKAPAKKA